MTKQSLLWELSLNGGTKSYLFGTMHVKDNRAFKHIERAKNAMYKCTLFKTEINLEEAKQKMNPSSYLLGDSKTISNLLGVKKFSKFRKVILRSMKLDLNHYDNFLPLIIVNKLAEMVLNEDNHETLDAFLWSEATNLKLLCDGLETLEEQVDILNSLDIEVQINMLKKVAKNISKFKKSIQKTGDLYVKEDITQLYKKTKKSLGPFRKIMLYQRNELMANRIFAHSDKSCFYAIGAAHLAGNKGVISILKKKGLKLIAI